MTPRWLSAAARIAGLVAVVALQVGWMRQPVPLALKFFQLALIGLAAWRPAGALLVLAGVSPLATAMWTLLGSPALGPRLLEAEDFYLTGYKGAALLLTWSPGTAFLEQLVLAVLTGALLRTWSGADPSRVSRPAAAVAAIAMTSAAALLPARLLAAAPDAYGWRVLSTIWSGVYATTPPSGQPLAPLFYACLIVEGLGLAWVAERATRSQPALVRRLVAVSVAASAAAVLLNVQAVVNVAMDNTDRLRSFLAFLGTRRASLQFDKNAAGSVFVLVLVSGILLLRRTTPRVLLVSGSTAVLAFGLWLTGSRAALLSLVVTLLGTIMFMIASHTPQTRRRLAIAAAVIIGATALLVTYYPHARNISLAGTVNTRSTVARAALRMTMSAPVFGVGIGTFIERSGNFGTGATDPTGLTGQHENAHNNFLQVLAEQGLVGLVAFLALIVTVVASATRGAGTLPERRWLLAGVCGFILTWLSGHPLLVPEAAFTFWLFFGMLAGLTPTPALRPPPRTLWWLPVVLLVSLPFRVASELKTADLNQVGVNLSQWEHDPDGTVYRAAGPTFSIYVEANHFVVVPVRRAPGSPSELRVDYRVDGLLINALTLTGDAWRPVELRLPSKHSRFVRVDFVVSAEGTAALPAACLHVGQDKAQ